MLESCVQFTSALYQHTEIIHMKDLKEVTVLQVFPAFYSSTQVEQETAKTDTPNSFELLQHTGFNSRSSRFTLFTLN